MSACGDLVARGIGVGVRGAAEQPRATRATSATATRGAWLTIARSGVLAQLGHADLAHAVMDASRAQAALRDLEAAALAEQQVGGGHAHILEQHLAVAVRRVVVAEDLQHADHLDARRLARHHDHRLLLVLVRVLGIRLPHEDEDLAARIADSRGPPLVAVDHVVVTVADDRRFDVRRIRRRDLGLGHGKGRADLALEQRLQPLLLEVLVGIPLEDLHVAGVGGGAVEDFRREVRAAHQLAERRVLEVGEAGAALALGQEEVPEGTLARLVFQVLHDRRDLPARGAGVELLVEDGLAGIDVLVHEVGDLLQVHLRLLRVLEIHDGPLWRCRVPDCILRGEQSHGRQDAWQGGADHRRRLGHRRRDGEAIGRGGRAHRVCGSHRRGREGDGAPDRRRRRRGVRAGDRRHRRRRLRADGGPGRRALRCADHARQFRRRAPREARPRAGAGRMGARGRHQPDRHVLPVARGAARAERGRTGRHREPVVGLRRGGRLALAGVCGLQGRGGEPHTADGDAVGAGRARELRLSGDDRDADDPRPARRPGVSRGDSAEVSAAAFRPARRGSLGHPLPGQRRGGVRDRRLAAGGRRLHRGLTFLRERRETFLALAACLIMLATSVPTEAEGLVTATLERDVRTLAAPDMRGRLRGTDDNARARAYIVSRLRAAGLAPLFGGSFEQPTYVEPGDNPAPVRHGTNLGAVFAAEERDAEWIVLVAHYDHLGVVGGAVHPGADDNASSVALLLALGDSLGRARPRLKRHVVLLFPDAEEPPDIRTERMGSSWFWRHPPPPAERLHLAIVLDLMGGRASPEMEAAGLTGALFVLGAEASRGLADFARALPPADGVEPVFLSLPMIEAVPYAPGRRFARSDYHGLREHLGRPFVFLPPARPGPYHTERDTPDTLDYAKLGRVTRWVAVLATHAAETDGPLEWRDFTADPLADARSLLRMSAGLGKHGRFPWPLRRALAADRRMVEQLLRRWDAGEAPTPESYRALVLASTRLQAAMWRPGGWYFALW